MNASEKPSPPETPTISTEAFIGIGITVAGLGVLCLLLGWAEYMRAVPAMAWTWLALGVVMLVLGVLAAAFPRSWHRRGRSTRALESAVTKDDAEREREPEEQLY